MTKASPEAAPVSGFIRLRAWLSRHKLDVVIVAAVVVVSGTVSAANMHGYPQRFEDEGTYISQAWAVQEKAALTHYTYWYDHPPLGWIQMAAYLTASDGVGRQLSAIAAGREFMLLLHVISIGLLYALARRLGIGALAAGLGTLAYGLSPLVVEFSRYALLDNVALPWLLGALLLALSPRRHVLTAIASAVCLTAAVMSKETFAVYLPVLAYALWSGGDKRNRRFNLVLFAGTFVLLCGFYILYATLKGELIPGDGHVSLLGSIWWQLFDRQGSGSVFVSSSNARGLLDFWLSKDAWLLLLGAVSLPVALIHRSLRVAGLSLLIGLLLLLRTGYLPYPFIISLLPFAALCFAGSLHYLVFKPLARPHFSWQKAFAIPAAALCAVIMLQMATSWQPKLATLTTRDHDGPSREAVAWIEQHISKDSRLVVESALWTDLQEKGFNSPGPVWLYKTETDPAVAREVSGWQGIDYVILNGPTATSASFKTTFGTVAQAIENATLIQTFGTDNEKVLVYEVDNQAVSQL